jgi:hypothetical protein
MHRNDARRKPSELRRIAEQHGTGLRDPRACSPSEFDPARSEYNDFKPNELGLGQHVRAVDANTKTTSVRTNRTDPPRVNRTAPRNDFTKGEKQRFLAWFVQSLLQEDADDLGRPEW